MAETYRKNGVLIAITILAIIIIGLKSFIQDSEGLRLAGFILFTFLCIFMLAVNRKAKGKVILIVLFWLIFGLNKFI